MKKTQRGKVLSHSRKRSEVVALEGELDGGFEEAEFVAGVVALAVVVEAADLRKMRGWP